MKRERKKKGKRRGGALCLRLSFLVFPFHLLLFAVTPLSCLYICAVRLLHVRMPCVQGGHPSSLAVIFSVAFLCALLLLPFHWHSPSFSRIAFSSASLASGETKKKHGEKREHGEEGEGSVAVKRDAKEESLISLFLLRLCRPPLLSTLHTPEASSTATTAPLIATLSG